MRQIRRAVPLVLGVLAAFLAIQVSTGGTPAVISTRGSLAWSVSPAVAAGSNGGCVQAASGSVTVTPKIDGHKRQAIVHVPEGYTGKSRVPVIFNLHGSESTAAQQEIFSGMDVTADAKGFIVVYPQGSIATSTGFDWNVPNEPLISGAAVPAGTPNDVRFLTGLVTWLEQRYCIAPKQVYATGMSGGGRMSSQLACDASTTFAAVAPVAGLRRPQPCPARPAVPVIAFHGTADPVDPYKGHGQKYWTYSVPNAAKRWGKQDGCTATPEVTHPVSGVTLTTYATCRNGAVVELYSIDGEGHEWPGGPHMPRRITSPLGPQSDAVSANTLMWQFFSQHPMR